MREIDDVFYSCLRFLRYESDTAKRAAVANILDRADPGSDPDDVFIQLHGSLTQHPVSFYERSFDGSLKIAGLIESTSIGEGRAEIGRYVILVLKELVRIFQARSASGAIPEDISKAASNAIRELLTTPPHSLAERSIGELKFPITFEALKSFMLEVSAPRRRREIERSWVLGEGSPTRPDPSASPIQPDLRSRSALDEAVRRFLAPTIPHGFPNMAFAASAESSKVVGIGYGFNIPASTSRPIAKLRLYVDSAPEDGELPAEIGGLVTEVIVTGKFEALVDEESKNSRPSVHRRRRRPARPGQSIGFFKSNLKMAGTLGALVQVGRRTCILSNNHVLANCDRLTPGTPIFQPGFLDGGVRDTDRIGTLSHVEPLNRVGSNDMDVAVAGVDDSRDVFPEFLRPVGWLRSPEPAPPARGMLVEKVGRNGYTCGFVEDNLAFVKVNYGPLGDLLFADQIAIKPSGSRPFAKVGDSGSVLISLRKKTPVALLFAISDKGYAFATPLDRVLKRIGATLRIR